MFDIDQDAELLALIQAAAAYRHAEQDDIPKIDGAHRQELRRLRMWRGKDLHDLGLKLDDAIEAIVAKYGDAVLTYDADEGVTHA